VTGVIQGVVITVVAQFLRHPGPDFNKGKAAPTAAAAAKSRRNTEAFTTPQMLQTSHFYILYLMFVAMATGGLFVTANSSSLVKSWGMTTAVLTTVVALNNVSNGVARIFWGWVSDQIGRENTMVVTFFLQSACLISVVTFGRTSSLVFTVTMILTFFTWGQIYSLFPSTNGDYFGAKNATSNYSFLYSAKGVASIIGAPIAAWLFGILGSWDAVFYGSACLAFLSGCTALVLRKRPLPQKTAVA
jgi:OFA family oxalate/formate antiporter-like MFS transporter